MLGEVWEVFQQPREAPGRDISMALYQCAHARMLSTNEIESCLELWANHSNLLNFQISISLTMAPVCDGCCLTELQAISRFFLNDDSLAFLRANGVLPTYPVCPNCEKPLLYRARQHIYYCQTTIKIRKTKMKSCGFSVSEFAGL